MTLARTNNPISGPVPYVRAEERPERARQAIKRERLAPSWLLGSLVLTTLGALLVLYPKTYIETSLRANPTPNTATLAYLQLMVRAHSDDGAARVMLADQALIVGDVRLARYALRPWLHEDMSRLPIRIAMLRLHALETELHSASGEPKRHARLADAFARDIVDLSNRMSVTTLMNNIRSVADLGHFTTAARLYRSIIDRANNAALRRQAFVEGIDTLLAAGQPKAALDFARSELARTPQDNAIWRRMVRLALMANQPHLAARYARRLVGMNRQ